MTVANPGDDEEAPVLMNCESTCVAFCVRIVAYYDDYYSADATVEDGCRTRIKGIASALLHFSAVCLSSTVAPLAGTSPLHLLNIYL